MRFDVSRRQPMRNLDLWEIRRSRGMVLLAGKERLIVQLRDLKGSLMPVSDRWLYRTRPRVMGD
jgi:hypothetical protein